MLPRFLRVMICASTLLISAAAFGQLITLPPDGDNQRASVSQHIGLVKVTIDYNSPDVHGPNGEDRTGKIWGQLVPYGLVNLGFGTCKECPWRAGANENTVFTVSHDVLVEGQKLAAGSYGVHMIPSPDDWTLIFSKNYTSWGSFTYDPKEDALRVKVKPSKSEFNEWLTYEFTDRKADKATVALKWENLQVPFTISVPNITDLYLASIRNELRTNKGFGWEAWNRAANFALQNNVVPAEALQWAQFAVSDRFFGQENFQSLSTLARALEANGKTAEAKVAMDKALVNPSATAILIHQYGRQLLTSGKKEEALKVFELNAKRYPNQWPVNVGLMRGHAALGHNKEALKFARLAAAQAPDELNRTNLQNIVKQLEEGKPIN
jgi:hypothetical protein